MTRCFLFYSAKVFVLLFLSIVPTGAYHLDIPVDNLTYTIEPVKEFQRINLEYGIIPDVRGAPEIPIFTHSFSLPHCRRIIDVIVVNEQWEVVPGEIYLIPVQNRNTIGQTSDFVEPDSMIYNRSDYYPASIVCGFHSGNLRGYRIGQVSFTPFRYNPVLKRLEVLRRLEVEVMTEECASGISPVRQTDFSRSVFRNIYTALTGEISVFETNSYTDENTGDLSPTELPSLLGPPVDLLIITTEQCVPAYEEFKRLKKRLGFNTTIRTVDWIKQHYQGVDDAERIRNFIKEAVEKWGVSFVLLGNDVPYIPTRWVWVEYVMGNYPAHITTDLYFSDLDGNWNRDGDDRFGEVTDSIDLYPDVLVGRIPAQNPDDVVGHLNKIYSYIFDYKIPPQGKVPYYRKSLFPCSIFISENDSYYMATRLSTHLPNYLVKKFLYEKPKQEYLDAIYDDYNLITFLAHGDVNLMRIKTNPRQYVTNFTYDSLSNTVYPLMVVITCYAGPFQEDCLGEHWVMNPHGGGIGFIGPTSSSVAQDQEVYVTFLFDALFKNPLGASLAWSKIPLIPQAQFDTWCRVFQYSLNLLGDPTLSLWRTTPNLIDTVVLSKDTLHLGSDTLTINVFPQFDTFFVVFNKDNELFVKDTGFAGISTTILKIKSAGYLKYTILKRDLIPYIDSVYVQPLAPYLTFDHYQVVDSSGNGNGIPNPDETIDLYLGLINNGMQSADSCRLMISSPDSFVTIIVDTTSYAIVLPGEIKTNLTPLKLRINTLTPDGYGINLFLQMNYGLYNSDTCQIIIESPKLSLFTQSYSTDSVAYWVIPYIENRGHCTADSVWAKIRSYSDTVAVMDSLCYFPSIAPGEIVPARDSFVLQLDYPGSVCYNFLLYYHDTKICEQRIVLRTIAKTDSLWIYGKPNSIGLHWKPVSGAKGYRIYRSRDPGGPFEFIINALTPVAYFEDNDVEQMTNYYYCVVAVDSSMNQGCPSDTVVGMTNPLVAPGWPRTVYGYLFSSPNFGDLDPDYPGLEITVCGKNGSVYVWHNDGTPAVNNPDGIVFQTNYEIWSSPAVGDVDSNGTPEIVFGIRKPDSNLYVLTKYNNCWVPLSGWPRSLTGGILGSAALADIDEDGDLEIFVITENGGLYAFHHTGEGVYSPDGLLKNLYGWHGGSPAIGDINNDGSLEIVVCGGSNSDSLFVWDRYGNYLEPFPVAVVRKISYSAVLGDLMGDDNLEICFYTDSTDMVNVINVYGSVLWQRDIYALGDVEAYPVLANIVGNERPEVICGSNKNLHDLLVYDSLGNIIPGFPPSVGNEYKLPIVADIDGDSLFDIVCGAADWNLYGFDRSANLLGGFPIHFGIRLEQSPAVYDIDNDGKLELMVGANDYKFWVFNLDSKVFDWPKFRYDPYNSGCYKSQYWPGIKEYIARKNKSKFYFGIAPNPFKKNLVIKFQIPDSNLSTRYSLPATLCIYDATGRLVKSFSDIQCNAVNSVYSVLWSGDDDLGRAVPAGVYFVRFEVGDFKQIKKAVMLK